MTEFWDILSKSAIRQPHIWSAAVYYDAVINQTHDGQIPAARFTRRPRPSDLWFDSDCRFAKRLTRMNAPPTLMPLLQLLQQTLLLNWRSLPKLLNYCFFASLPLRNNI